MVRKHVVVLGGERESKFRQSGRTESYSSNKKSKPLYNHCMNSMCVYICVVFTE